jgi:hypothetical protein
VPYGAHASVPRNNRVQPAQRIELSGAQRAKSRKPSGRRAVEHDDNRAVMVVMLATVVEQAIDGGAGNTALLHPCLRVSGDAWLHRRSV